MQFEADRNEITTLGHIKKVLNRAPFKLPLSGLARAIFILDLLSNRAPGPGHPPKPASL